MKHLLLFTLSTISLSFGMANLTRAASLTPTQFGMSFNRATSELPLLRICADIGICKPNVATVVPDVNPGIETPPQPYLNDTGFIITGVFAKLPTNRPEGLAVFVEGSSDIFSKINISSDKQELSFTGGTIAVNEVIIADFTTEPNEDSTLFMTLVTVPEPSSLLATLCLGFLGSGLWLNKKKRNNKPLC